MYNQSGILESKADKTDVIQIPREIFNQLPKLYKAVVEWGIDLGEIILVDGGKND